MKKVLDLIVIENSKLNKNYSLLKLSPKHNIDLLPDMYPGQFVEVHIEKSPSTFLRRPISINFVDKKQNQLWLLVQAVGKGTQTMVDYKVGDSINLLLPLGNSFSIPETNNPSVLLVGGGVGIAPLLYLGMCMKNKGITPFFLLGARSKDDLLELDLFEQFGNVYTTTEDGSYGEKGYVTDHSVLSLNKFSHIYTCGPKPMMMAIAQFSHQNNIECEVSLENLMACGFGVCLCCVENTKKGNLCACTEGPVFNIKDLKWID